MSTTFTLFFEPLDVLQFRDARPFDAGLHVHARSIFPLPSVFLGAVRTALMRHAGVDFGGRSFHVPEAWRPLLGDAREPAAFQMRGPLLTYRAHADGGLQPLFHAPADLYRSESGELDEFGVLGEAEPEAWGFRRWRWNGRGLDPQSGAVAWTGVQAGKDDEGALWLSPAAAKVYLEHTQGPLRFADHERPLRADEIFAPEPRTGIARDDGTLATLQGLFYVTAPFRLRSDARGGYGFAVDLRLPDTLGALSPDTVARALDGLDGSVVPLGGKARRALVRVTRGALLPHDLDGADGRLPAGRRRKLWLVTPLPWSASAPAPLRAVAGRATRLSGFNFAGRAPRPLLRALPAGSVLVTADDVRDHLAREQRLAGYGTALVKEL